MFRNLLSLISQFAPLLLTFLLAVSSYWVALQSEKGIFGHNTGADPSKPDYFIQNFHTEEHHVVKGLYTQLTGLRADHIPAQDVLLITKPAAQRHQLKTGAAEVRITAENARHELQKELLHLENQVHIQRDIAGKRSTLDTEKMTAELQTHRVYSDQDAQIVSPGRSSKLRGFVMDTDSGDFQSKGHTSITIEAKQK